MKLQQLIGFVLILAASLLLSLAEGFAQADVTIVYNNGNESTFGISENGRMYFDDDILVIDDGSGNAPQSIQIESIGKILLQEQQNTATDKVEGGEMRIYPVPCENELFIGGINLNNSYAEVYSLTGELLLKQRIAGGRIDVSRLAAGVYLIRIDGKTQKFYKL